MAIQNFVKGHKCKGVIAERAEKVFLTHMEIIRLKYPGTLQKLHEDSLVRTLHRVVEFGRHGTTLFSVIALIFEQHLKQF